MLGLDGGTWDVLDPLIETGQLPNIASLVEDGRAGPLESTFPPVTAPAWLSMATGRNPGKTGVFYFVRREAPDAYEFSPVDAGDYRNRSHWDYLSAAGRSVGVFNVPLLYPPYEVDGYAVSGVGAEGDGPHTYPPELAAELDDVTGGYEVKVPYASPEYADRPGALVADLRRVIEKRAVAIEYLLETHPTDHFFGVVSATDWAQHYLWPEHDPSHPLHDPSSPHTDALAAIWRQVDDLVGTVAAIAARRDATLALVSDHGFGPTERTFNVTEWLEREGFLVRPASSPLRGLPARYFPHLRRIGEAVARVVPPVSDALERFGRQLRPDQRAGIDMERSVAFAPRQNLGVGLLYLLDDRRRSEVVGALESAAATAGVELSVHEPSDLYHGDATDLAPDVLFTMDGLACAVDARQRPGADLLEPGPPSRARSANHRMDGIYLLAGRGVEPRASRERRDLLDVAPTVLFAHDLPVPEWMDGEVMTDAFEPSFAADRRVRRTAAPRPPRSGSADAVDLQTVHEQIGDLGYR